MYTAASFSSSPPPLLNEGTRPELEERKLWIDKTKSKAHEAYLT